ncbi:MAG TPA: Npt1/Npt2 family nucleotide transporter, partial [Cyclobacteriaceae bacterium]|nr:Npt1/Npt2 family nucleotide transporter [Cyclobacteriaceae bacterium]
FGLYRFGPKEYHNEILFFMYCITGPMTALLLLCYWGIFGRLFDFRQSKRIIGWIDTGQLVATILAFLLIPLTLSYFVDTENYLIVCCFSILGSLLSLIFISVRYKLTKNDPVEFEADVKQQTSLTSIFKDKYTVLLSVFIIISMMTAMFSQYAFQDTINKQYPKQQELTGFLALFNLAIYVISLIMQTFVNDRIMSNYGLRVSLFILPIVVGIFALGSVLSGLFFGYELESAPETFVFFFLFVAITRFFNSTLRDSLENPVYKLFFIPLDSRYRFGIQTKIEGVVNESGRFVAGVVIFLFALITFFKIIWIPFILLALVGAYMWAAKNLYNGYRSKIRSKLEVTGSGQDKLEIGFTQITNKLESLLGDQEKSKAVFSFKLLEKIDPARVSEWVNALMKNKKQEAQDYAQRRMNEIKGLSVSERYVIKMDQRKTDADSKNLLTYSDLQLIINSGGDVTKTRIQKLTRSPVVEDRQYAAELLLHSSVEENTSFLIELLNDLEPKVRHTAIKTAIKRNSHEVIFALIENLDNPLYANQAMNALVLIGSKAFIQLDNAFYRSGQNTHTLLKIIQIIGRIGGQRAKDLLWNRIDYPDKVIGSQILLSLGECGFKAGISQITRIKYAIENDIADITWNLNAIQELGRNESTKIVKTALQREVQNDIDHIYMLLAMLYDTRSIELVKENIESGTAEGSTYAVELLDVFLSEQLKQRVIPVLDDLSIAEKINRLEAFYPWVKLDEKLVLKFLINRDFTQSNRWTKAVVLYEIGTQRINDFSLDLIAHLFNPDRLIREAAAWALYQMDPKIYHDNAARLGDELKQDLDEVIIQDENRERLMKLEKVLFYRSQSVFEGVPALALSFLADISEEVIIDERATLIIDEKLNNNFYIVYAGEVEFYENGSYANDFKPGQFIGEMVASQGFAQSNIIIAKENTQLLRIDKDQFYELLADNVRLADRILEFI